MKLDPTFVMHHVGARGGSAGFTMPDAFRADVRNVLYEPDSECLHDLEELSVADEGHNIVLPFALGARRERRIFYAHQHPLTSSFRSIDERYAEYSEFAAGQDYVLKDSTRRVREEEVLVDTIDNLTRSETASVPPPDLLLVDTEGMDFDVLEGARESLRNSVVAISVETQLQPVWGKGPLFGDICELLDGLGFDLASIHLHNALSPLRCPIGLRGRGMQTSCDAIFLRRIDMPSGSAADSQWLLLHKLAFASISLGFIEYGLKALKVADSHSPAPETRERAETRTYMKFLDRVRRAREEMPSRFPRAFGVSGDPTVSHVLPSGETIPTGLKGRVKSVLLNYPRLLKAVRSARVPALNTMRRIQVRARQATARYTAFEQVLLDHGFQDVAEMVRSRRIEEEAFAL